MPEKKNSIEEFVRQVFSERFPEVEIKPGDKLDKRLVIFSKQFEDNMRQQIDSFVMS